MANRDGSTAPVTGAVKKPGVLHGCVTQNTNSGTDVPVSREIHALILQREKKKFCNENLAEKSEGGPEEVGGPGEVGVGRGSLDPDPSCI